MSCTKKTKKKEQLSNQYLDSLYQKSIVLRDSINYYWKLIQRIDSQKLADIHTLLYQISLTKSPDLNLIEKGYAKLEKLKNLKYSQEDVHDDDKVDLFDNTCDSVIQFVFELKDKTPYADNYPILNKLKEDIIKNNSMDLAVILRVNYNKWASQYNETLQLMQDAKYPAANFMKKVSLYSYAN
jgi:hypothetical protein